MGPTETHAFLIDGVFNFEGCQHLNIFFQGIFTIPNTNTSNFVWSIFTNPSARAGYDTRSIFKRSLTGLYSEFSFSKTSCPTKAEEPSLPYYLPIVGGRIIGFIPFPGVLVLCEMQSVSTRIWTRVAVSSSYDDNHYTTGTSKFCLIVCLNFDSFQHLKTLIFIIFYTAQHRRLHIWPIVCLISKVASV